LPEPPSERAALVALLHGRGYSEAHIADRLGWSEQMVSQIVREADR